MNLRTVLCPVDFSDPSQHALRWAAALARRFGARLTVMTAVDPLLAEAARVRLGLDLARTETEPELQDFTRIALAADGIAALEPAFEVRIGQPADAIVDAASRGRSDLVVMGTQGLGGLKRMLLGSTAARVLRSARVPVLAVPPQAPPPSSPDSASFTVAGIVAAVDFSETAAAALQWADDLARELGAPLTLVHVVEPVVAAPKWSAYVSGSDDAQREQARGKIDMLATNLVGRHEAVVAVGAVAETIAATAEQRRAGLIAVGLTGEQGPFAPRPGSVAYRVLTLAQTPVLVVPSNK